MSAEDRVGALYAEGWKFEIKGVTGIEAVKAGYPDIAGGTRYVAFARRSDATLLGFGVSSDAALADLLANMP